MRKIIIGIIALAMISMGLASGAPTIVDVDWDTAGHIDIVVDSDDDFDSAFHMFSASQVTGNYYLTDSESNPYGYGVDTVSAQVEAQVIGGGFMEFENIRTDSKVSMYGEAGERSYTNIYTDDTAQLQFRTRGNYADLQSSNYGFHANNQFMATGDFGIYHSIADDTGEGAWLVNTGFGSTDIDLMSESTWGKTGSFKFGEGCGCYTNADITATGTGFFELGAIAENQITGDHIPFEINGDGTLGSASYLLQVDYGSGFSFGNFAISGN